MVISSTVDPIAVPIATRAPDQQSETSVRALWPAVAPSLALNVIAVLLVFCALYFAASLLVPIASAAPSCSA